MVRNEMAQVEGFEGRTAQGRRSALEVTMAILKATSEGARKPTHLMYASNTSWVILQKNIQSLLSSGLIRECGARGRCEYAITESGFAVLRDFDKLVERTSPIPLEALPG